LASGVRLAGNGSPWSSWNLNGKERVQEVG